jgi:site-specific DNA-methyltransferase (adenine-specific)
MHDGSDAVVLQFPAQAGAAAPVHRRGADKFRNTYGAFAGNVDEAGSTFHGDEGSAARFFYCAKASKRDREEGCEGLDAVVAEARNDSGRRLTRGYDEVGQGRGNIHPTVKPTDLMRWLVRLVTPPGGLVFDPFTGSGSTGKAAILEQRRFLGAELTAEYIPIARARIAWAQRQVA